MITRDRRMRTRDVHARGYGGETPRAVRVENGGKIGAVDLWWEFE